MSLNQTTATRIAIYENAHRRFAAAAVLSFQPEGIDANQYTYKKIAQMLGADLNDLNREILLAMNRAIRTANNNEAGIRTSDEANAFITRIRRVAVVWGVQEHFIDMSMTVNGLRLLEVATS